MPHLQERAPYVIRIGGSIDKSLVDWFGPVDIASASQEDGRTISELSGIVTDQAGLVGLIRHLHGLGIVLLSVERGAHDSQAK
ncbi:MAG: hypothetical protein M1482_00880 [Chloroflexi bacterium]|nr:hypothetical protein [Chloroflexota bacterium]